MIFILPGLLLIGAICVTIWALVFRGAIVEERAILAARKREADFDRLLSTPGEPLYCLCCREPFRGPMDGLGCPRCHVKAFVIPIRASDDPAIIGCAVRIPAIPVSEVAEDTVESPDTMEIRPADANDLPLPGNNTHETR